MEKVQQINHIKGLKDAIPAKTELLKKVEDRKTGITESIRQCMETYFKKSRKRTAKEYFEILYTEVDDKIHVWNAYDFAEHSALLEKYGRVEIIARFILCKNEYKALSSEAPEKMFEVSIEYMKEDIERIRSAIDYLIDVYKLDESELNVA